MNHYRPNVVWFNQVDKDDVALVGGKGANLGEMVQAGFPVPNGFIVTAPAYFSVLDHNNLRPKIKELLTNLDVQNTEKLETASRRIKKLISGAKVPHELADEIIKHYLALDKGSQPLVAVRSSATAEDLPGASFAGQQVTFLNIKGAANLIETIRETWASLFEPRAIFYRQQKGFDHFKVGIAIPVQKMIQSDVSGVMFTVDPVTQDKHTLVIEAIWGLGELIVQGAVTPDRYIVDKNTGKIIKKYIVEQIIELVKKREKDIEVKVPENRKKTQKISDALIREISKLGKALQQHYFFPQDIEWAIENNKIYLLQTRPITTLGQTKKGYEEIQGKSIAKSLKLILKGDPASPGISSGKVRVIQTAKGIGKIIKGEILVTKMTTPDFVPAMKKVSAIITDKGGQTSHAAIVSRELGITCVVGTVIGTHTLHTGQLVTVNGKTGEIFNGSVKPQKIKTASILPGEVKYDTSRTTATKIYVNLGEPDLVSEVASKNVDGVGLLRAEFMVAQIGIHPKKMIHDHKSKQFINKLAEGLEVFCRSFFPRPVVYRATDFKTNEYRNLIGGAHYEPQEQNPMLGYRGAYRYISDEAVFDLELEAIKIIRNKTGYKNLWLMIPFVHTVKELAEVKKIVASQGLFRSPSFKFWMMVEIPSNVILLDEFIDVGIDGVSVGTNDLTMLILGIDRDNEEITSQFDERNPAVLWALEKIIKTANKRRITSSVCGQAPSMYPEFTQKLVEWGITSVSVSPDAIEQTRDTVYQAELRVVQR